MQKKAKYILDDNMKRLAVLTNKRHDQDIPQWLSTSILMSIPVMTVFSIYNKNPMYLSSRSGYATGNNVYNHINEALLLKDYLQNGTFNFWFPDTLLGYPMYLKSVPLPAMITAVLMICLERLASPLCIFRWMIVSLISFMPVVWYKGGRGLLLTRFQSVILSLLVFTINSNAQTGLELDAFLLHGLYPLLFAMFLLPLTISSIYLHGMQFIQQNKSSPVYLLTLTYLCHKAVGLYCSTIAFSTMFVFILTKEFSKDYVRSAVLRFVAIHLRVVLYLSWWIIPVVITYPYSLRSSSDSLSSFSSLLESYVNGQLFDFHRHHTWLTCLTGVGLAVLVKRLWGLHRKSPANLIHYQIFTIWFSFALLATVFLNVGSSFYSLVAWIVPIDFNSDNSLQIVGLHYCGLFLISMATAVILNVWSYVVEKPSYLKILKFLGIVLLSVTLVKISTKRISERVTFIEVGDDFRATLKSFNAKFQDGRILLHHKLGTGGAWDLANIPHISGKPGLMTSSHLKDESLSRFYLESMTLDDVDSNQFQELLELYNVHYIGASIVYQDRLLLHQARYITTVEDIRFSEIDSYDHKYGYFDFVRLPGYIDGNLNNVRQTVLTSLQLYSKKVLFYLNPRRSSNIRLNSLLSVQVLGVSFYDGLSSSGAKLSLVNWKLNGEDVDSLDAISTLEDLYDGEMMSSYVVEEMRTHEEYHAVVHSVGMETLEKVEHLLLKVSYHPFWRCTCIRVPETYMLKDFDSVHLRHNRTSLTVHHVTPNMIAVQIPPGRYHVIFRYRFPGILKLLALICFLVFMHGFLRLSSVKYLGNIIYSLDKTLTLASELIRYIYTCGVLPCDTSLNIKIQYHIRHVLSFIATPVLTLKNKCSQLKTSAVIYRSSLASIPTKSWFILKDIKETLTGKHVVEGSITSYPVEDSREVEKELISKDVISVPSRHNDTFSDRDSSFSYDGLFVNASPPTPPKHTKKSVRKRHARTGNNNNVIRSPREDPDSLFSTSSVRVEHSPRVKKLLSELRNSASSSSQEFIISRESSPTVRRRMHSPGSDKDNRHYVDTYQKTVDSEFVDHYPMLPADSDARQSSPVHDDVVDDGASSSGELDQRKIDDHFIDCSGCNSEMRSTNNLDFRHDINVDFYSHGIENTNVEPEETAYVRTPIDVSRFLTSSTVKDHDDDSDSDPMHSVDSFSPERSSSPDLTHPSPDQLSVSLDDSSESSFEYTPLTPNDDSHLPSDSPSANVDAPRVLTDPETRCRAAVDPYQSLTERHENESGSNSPK